MSRCIKCGSYAINHSHHGRDGSDDDLCDVCFWRSRVSQWKQIESAPKDGTFYLATNGKLQRVENCPPGHVAGIWHRIDGDWRGHALSDDSTHWQPLPAPPEVE